MLPAILLVVGIAIGFGLNPWITQLATDPKAANPLPIPRHPLLGGPTWVGLLVAAASGLMAWVCYRDYGVSLRGLYWYLISVVYIVIATVDWKVRLIDVLLVMAATLTALLGSAFLTIGIKASLIGSLIAGLLFLLFFAGSFLLFPNADTPFGLGDVYLAFLIGATLGWQHLGVALMYGMGLAGIASIGILAVRQFKGEGTLYIAYGTFLCLGVLLYLIRFGPL
ncbi:MAG TPA: hypothetical protein DEF47_13950 [Herpetosiphon sp.]|uniref:Peptidase A24A prepilin type IV n=1 Tax=Herpetosiphon aurantiacus (strain ATCC 23779 / DSM 785 / 114-95) TaxID=316274 RepID=A9AZP7_HERA2|nr:prepilin peptidase [Herpetosiphon sp.]ABX07101.1 peptidase A24A prepilin type IV [Herpetosiphon aurantiacus DSM 785]HBW50992.1 hypothetical protein [Herpetosiphon sp.]